MSSHYGNLKVYWHVDGSIMIESKSELHQWIAADEGDFRAMVEDLAAMPKGCWRAPASGVPVEKS